ncbi:PAS domain S-box protein, partial [bacterium]|nr:PAS domain S-box protein [bacterium]
MNKRTFRLSLLYQYGTVVALCLALFAVIRNWEIKNLKKEFLSTANEFILTLQDTINVHLEVLSSIRSFCEAFSITHEEFDTFISPMLEKYPSIHSITWLPHIAAHSDSEHSEPSEEKADSLPIGIYPSGVVLGIPRYDENYPSYYDAAGNSEEFHASDCDSMMLAAIIQARDAGMAVTIPQIDTLNNESLQLSTHIALAVYNDNQPVRTTQERRTSIKGFLVSEFCIPDIQHKFLSEVYKQMKFSLRDITDTFGEDSLSGKTNRNVAETLQSPIQHVTTDFLYEKKITLGQRCWLVSCSLPNEKISTSVWQSRTILLLGLLFSSLLFLYISITQKMTVKLRANEHRFRSLTALSPVGIFQTDTRGTILYVNERWTAITGLSPEESYKNNWINALHPLDKERIQEDWNDALTTTSKFTAQFRFQPDKKTIAWVFGRAIPWHDDNGITQGYIGTIEDITEHKNMYQQLQEKEEYLRTVFDSAPTGIFLIDPDTKNIVDMNLTAREYLELVDTVAQNEIPYSEVYPSNSIVLDTSTFVEQSESILVSCNKDEIAVLRNIVPVVQHGKTYLLETFMDIAEQKILQRQLMKSQNMASVGSLAAGVAHEFNNILLIISGFAKLNSDNTNIDEIQNALKTIAETTHRGEKIVGSLLSLARQEHSEEKQLYRIDTILQRDIILFDKELQKNSIELIAHIEEVPEIACFPYRLSQVFINMIKNAIHAMHNSPKKQLAIALWHGTKAQASKAKHSNKPQDYLYIAISDTGHGMNKEVRERIFEPFFTTKGVLSGGSDSTPGTGLGLSISYGIIEDHNGTIFVESTENAGTTFTIAIPLASQTASL